MRRVPIFVSVLCLLWPLSAMAETRLVMLERPGCHWCEEWHAVIGPIYPKTAEGKFAPLQTEQIHAQPKDLTLTRPARFTPTFVLTENGQELARIEGYPGEDFFWGMLEKMLKDKTDYESTP